MSYHETIQTAANVLTLGSVIGGFWAHYRQEARRARDERRQRNLDTFRQALTDILDHSTARRGRDGHANMVPKLLKVAFLIEDPERRAAMLGHIEELLADGGHRVTEDTERIAALLDSVASILDQVDIRDTERAILKQALETNRRVAKASQPEEEEVAEWLLKLKSNTWKKLGLLLHACLNRPGEWITKAHVEAQWREGMTPGTGNDNWEQTETSWTPVTRVLNSLNLRQRGARKLKQILNCDPRQSPKTFCVYTHDIDRARAVIEALDIEAEYVPDDEAEPIPESASEANAS